MANNSYLGLVIPSIHIAACRVPSSTLVWGAMLGCVSLGLLDWKVLLFFLCLSKTLYLSG